MLLSSTAPTPCCSTVLNVWAHLLPFNNLLIVITTKPICIWAWSSIVCSDPFKQLWALCGNARVIARTGTSWDSTTTYLSAELWFHLWIASLVTILSRAGKLKHIFFGRIRVLPFLSDHGTTRSCLVRLAWTWMCLRIKSRLPLLFKIFFHQF